MAAYFQHQQQQHASNIPTKQQQHEQHKKQLRQNTPSPVATTTTTNNNLMATKTASPIPKSPLSMKSSHGDLLLEELQRKSEANDLSVSLELASPKLDKNHNNNNMLDNNNKSHTFTSGATLMSPGPGYKETLDQFLQRRRSSSASILVGDNLRNYSQLLLSSSSAATSLSCTDTSSCKEKSSSSSTSSTPPPTSALLAQHQHLSQMLKSPSDASLFGEIIEEETRCIVCNAHFPNVWLLEQHAALQHPHVGPGEEKPFICEQCGQSYRYRSAYAKHKEQNHRARLPADKLFTCDVCGMQFRYLKSFKKHRLNHALERLHGKKSLVSNSKLTPSAASFGDHDIVTSSQEPTSADDGIIEDLRIKIKRERDQRDDEDERDEEQDNTIDSAGINMTTYNDNSSASASTNATESNITSSDVIYSTNKKHRLLTHSETDPSYQCLQQQVQQTLPPLPPQSHMHAGLMNAGHQHQLPVPISVGGQHHAHAHSSVTATAASLSSLNSLSSITSLINADRIPSEQFLGLNPQEASILNFLRVDAAERQRDKRPQASRFACPFCGKCVRSKENLKLHVRKHTGERPFVCLFCGRAFGGKSDLTRHLRIHTGERPYHCESCGKCFARADYLSKHLTTHIHNAPR